MRPPGGACSSCSAATRQRPREVRPAVAAERQQVVDDRGGRPRAVVIEQHERLGRERDDAAAQLRTAGADHGRRRDGRQRHRVAAHRAAAVDQQADRARCGSEPARDQLIRLPGAHPQAALERPVEVEVAVDPAGLRDQPPGPARHRDTHPPQPRKQPFGEPPRLAAERRISRDSKVRQQRERGVAVARQLLLQRGQIEPADVRRDVREARVGCGEAVTVERPACLAIDGPPRLGGAQGAAPSRWLPAGGAPGLPCAGSGSGVRAPSSSSAITSSAVRSWSSWTLIRPDIAAIARIQQASRRAAPAHAAA